MREVKFRVWDKQYKLTDYDFSNNYLITHDGKILERVEKSFADQYWHEYEETDQFVLMQYTGLKDKNGKGIYEGDIIRDETGSGIVKWIQEHCAFLVFVPEPSGYHYLNSDGQLKNSEVIGNIYEDPGLLEGDSE